jgi:hypothetical protein
MSGRETKEFDKHVIPIKFLLGCHVLPNVYRHYYFQNKDPTDPSYELSRLFYDILALYPIKGTTFQEGMSGYIQYVSADNNTVDDKRIRFRQVAKEDLIDNRSWAVESIEDGLTMEGVYYVFFFAISLVMYSHL